MPRLTVLNSVVPTAPVRVRTLAPVPERSYGAVVAILAIVVLPPLVLWGVAASGELRVLSDWTALHLGHGQKGDVPVDTLALGELTTDVRDDQGGVYTLDVNVSVELADTVPDDQRARLVAAGRDAVLQGIRHLPYDTFDADHFDEVRERLTARVTRKLGQDRVGRVLFTDLAFYPGPAKPPIAPIRPMAPSAPQNPNNVVRRPVASLPPFSNAGR